jgi:hypothetical protein
MATKKHHSNEIVKKAPSNLAILEKPAESKHATEKTKAHTHSSSSSTTNLTHIIIKYDVGFGNHLYIRGHGSPNLSWDKGIALKNVKSNEWVFETNVSFTQAEFKILINDKVYEIGPNHVIKCGSSIHYTPKF